MGKNLIKRDYMLVPKRGAGCIYYTSKENVFKDGLIEVVDKDGFQTIVSVKNYIIVLN